MKRCAKPLAGIVLGLVASFCQAAVTVEETTVTLPTYPPGPCDKNPVFYTGRVYQGAQGRVYPYPLQDVLHDEKVNKDYTALLLENEYLKMSLLPEVGGRLFSFTDKAQRLRDLLPPIGHQARADRHVGRVDFRGRGVELPAPSPGHDVHAGRLHDWRRTRTGARRSGSARRNCATA